MINPDALVSGPDAAAVLPDVTTDMIRQWAHRGYKNLDGQRVKLEVLDYCGERNAARYRWSDLADAERATRRNPRSPGRQRLLVAA